MIFTGHRLHLCWLLTLLVALSGRGFAQTTNPAAMPGSAAEPGAGNSLNRAAMRLEMNRLAGICDTLHLVDEAILCRGWVLAAERSDQRRLYLPVELPSEDASRPQQARWCRYFTAARRGHAQWLYTEAQRLAQAGKEAEAFRTLWQVMREDPEHAEGRRVLGSLVNAVQVRPKLRPGTAAHLDFGWPARSYNRVQTPHFMLTSRADSRASIDIAQRLEAAHALWSQLFFEQWAKPGQLAAKLAGENSAWNESRKMEVILLKDREEYIETLGVREANIGVSVGYYNNRAKQSFFYPSEELQATFFHELTHQLFAESSRIDTLNDAGSQGGIWILEGIALYMESLRSHGTYWTVGGIDAPRLQTARYRAVRDGYWPGWNSFVGGTIDQWKEDPNVALYYAHAAGLTHTLFDLLPAANRNSDNNDSRERYMAALTATYEGRPTSSLGLLGQLAEDEEAAKLKYQELMTVTDEQMVALNRSRVQVAELVLAGSEFKPETWQTLAEQKQLQWLDLSFCNCTSRDVGWLGGLKQLERLSVEGTAVDGAMLKHVAELRAIEELDLSGCAIDDAALQALRGHPKLEILWLTNTAVTDAALGSLATLPNLKACDIGGTKITPAAWEAFLRQHPLTPR